MHRNAGRLAVVLSLVFFIAACGPSPQQRTARLLDDRLQAQLAPDIDAGRVAVQALPDGARVTLLGSSMLLNGPQTLDEQYPAVRANVIEGLLDPTLMRVQVADTSSLPAAQRTVRVRNVETYFAANGLGSVLVPAGDGPADAGPEGLTITISVCPPPNDRIGYGICLLSSCAARRDGASSLRHQCYGSR
jgi:hypothetical protein